MISRLLERDSSQFGVSLLTSLYISQFLGLKLFVIIFSINSVTKENNMSVPGRLLQSYAQTSNLRAVVLLGATISRNSALRDFPVPVLTLAAELDGMTRMSRIAEEYEKLTGDVLSFFRGLYRTPVIYIEGANHAQFASGQMIPHVASADLTPNITEAQAHREIGKYVNDFLTVSFSSVDSRIDEALDHLSEAFLISVKKFQPFLDLRNLDTDREESMWTVMAQELFAAEYADRVAVSNEVFENPWFFGKLPSLSLNGNGVIISTAALVHAADKSDDLQFMADMESPHEINMKLVSKEAIWKAFISQNDTALRSEPNTCESLNRFALYLALAVSTDAARERYYSRGRPIIFEEDAMRGMNILWVPSPLQMWEDKDGLHVRSVAMVTSTEHYCKVMSPYRAMEWVNIDSLRKKVFRNS